MLNMHAPSVFALLPDNSNAYQYFYPAGIIISVAVSLFFVAFVQQSSARMSPRLLVELSLASVLLIPFFLPKMHERYFFAADVISIVFAAFSPAYYYVAIGISAVSFLAYQPYLFGQGLVPMAWLALALLAILTVVLWRTVLDLRPCPPGFGDQESPAPT
jgi:hypothetical protein